MSRSGVSSRNRKRWIAVGVLSLAAVAAWVLCWDSEYCSIKDHLVPRRFATVLPGKLFRSGQIDPGLIEKVLAPILLIRAFRCHRCGARFYSPPAIVANARKSRNEEGKLGRDDKMEHIGVVPLPRSADQVVVRICPEDKPDTRDSAKPEVENTSVSTPFVWVQSTSGHGHSGSN